MESLFESTGSERIKKPFYLLIILFVAFAGSWHSAGTGA